MLSTDFETRGLPPLGLLVGCHTVGNLPRSSHKSQSRLALTYLLTVRSHTPRLRLARYQLKRDEHDSDGGYDLKPEA